MNRIQHAADYDEAIKGYKKAAIHALQSKLEELEANPLTSLHFTLAVPISYQKAYDQVICMLEMETRNEIELTAEQFSSFVMDDWAWKEGFGATVGFYKTFK